MNISVKRYDKSAGFWRSLWYIDGVFFSHGLSLCDGREVPCGTWPVRMVDSPKWSPLVEGRKMPWIDTDETTDDYTLTHEHRLIHWGSKSENTTGCELIGFRSSIADMDLPLTISQTCWYVFYKKITDTITKGEEVNIKIEEI